MPEKPEKPEQLEPDAEQLEPDAEPEPDPGQLRASLPSSGQVRGASASSMSPPPRREQGTDSPPQPQGGPQEPQPAAPRPRPSDYRDEGARALIEGVRAELRQFQRAALVVLALLAMLLVALVAFRGRSLLGSVTATKGGPSVSPAEA
jgi:hypothetical protein